MLVSTIWGSGVERWLTVIVLVMIGPTGLITNLQAQSQINL